MDYGKFKYQEQKKAAEARKKQKTFDVKEIKMRPNIDVHDYEVKMKSMRKFLDVGDKIISKELEIATNESVIAKDLNELQNKFPEVKIGSYPFFGGTSIVFRSFNKNKLDECYKIISNKLHE